jgi:hypothetical protein
MHLKQIFFHAFEPRRAIPCKLLSIVIVRQLLSIVVVVGFASITVLCHPSSSRRSDAIMPTWQEAHQSFLQTFHGGNLISACPSSGHLPVFKFRRYGQTAAMTFRTADFCRKKYQEITQGSSLRARPSPACKRYLQNCLICSRYGAKRQARIAAIHWFFAERQR